MYSRVTELEEEVSFMKSELERYRGLLKLSNRDRFGSKSEDSGKGEFDFTGYDCNS